MGYIPALLVIFGGGFLWGILVQSTLKAKRDILSGQLKRLKELVAERDRMLQALFNEIPPLDLANINSNYLIELQAQEYSFKSNFYSQEQKAAVWVDKIIQTLTSENYPVDSLTLLAEIASKLKLELKEYLRLARSYNQLVESKPTSFMASLLRFEKITI